MAFIDRLNMKTLAIAAGLCAAAIASSPHGGAAPMATGCPGGTLPGKECGAPSAAFNNMAGVPLALPGPVPAPAAPAAPVVPAAPPLPVVPAAPVPVVPAGAPLAGAPVAGGAPAAGGAPLTVSGGLAGKGDPVVSAPAGAPVPGQPISPGPSSSR